MARFRLIPREEAFFQDFTALARELVTGARLLDEMVAPDEPLWDHAEAIRDVEHRCDALTHEQLKRLHRTFVTPLDREDIFAMARALDDVMDAIDAVAAALSRYKVKPVLPPARELTGLIVLSTAQLLTAMEGLQRHVPIRDAIVEVNRLENQADRVHDAALQALFAHKTDVLDVIRWKEIFDILEQAIDRCEDVADLIDGIIVKHA